MPSAKLQLRLAQSAQSDLLEAWLYTAENNLTSADRLLDRIDAEMAALLMQPMIGRARPELAAGL